MGAKKAKANALLLWPASIIIKLYDENAKAMAPAAANQGFTRNTENKRYAPNKYNKTVSTGLGKTVFKNEIT